MLKIFKLEFMKKSVLLTALWLLGISSVFAQNQQTYSELVNEAWGLYESKNFQESAEKYSEAFKSKGDKGAINDRYNAACSWALAKEIDSSFVQLFRISEKGNYTNYSHITTDSDLSILHSDKRWNEVINLVKVNKEKAEANLDKPLVAILDSVYKYDQGLRMQANTVYDKYGRDSQETKDLWKSIAENDSLNLIIVKKILDERGWLGADIIGNQGNTTLFLVIQHADLKTQEKYLPMMREAVKKGNARPSALALLEDRVALGQGKRQLYGSQIGLDRESGVYYVLPLEDPENVDKRRAAMELGDLQDYVSNWNIVWDVEKYIKELPDIEAKQKK
jgi:hypothetical protein